MLAFGCALLLCQIGTLLEGRAVGLAAGLALLLPGFNSGIFNYIFPYAYATPLGLLLGLLCAERLVRHLLSPDRTKLIGAGLAAGASLLTKPEIGVACYAMLAFGIGMQAAIEGSIRPLRRSIALCVPGLLLWLGIYGWFFWKVTPRLIDNWQYSPGATSRACLVRA
jgi:hypothetical protein